MYNDEEAPIFMMMHHEYVSIMFRHWKLVKAGDICPAGAFCNSTIEGLSDILDDDLEDDDVCHMFPSSSSVSWER